MAKQLFNSTEKSNFILNMTEEKYSSLASKGLIAACLMTSIATAIPEITSENMYSVSAAGLAISGVICMILALIGLVKKYITGKALIPVCAFGAMLLLAIISSLTSYDLVISLYGYTGRGEGLLALIFYFSFFVTATAIKRESAIDSLITAVICTGALNSVWSLIQIFTGKLGQYSYVSIESKINAASGLCQSPIFLAMVLSLSVVAALFGFMTARKKLHRILCIICLCLFSFVLVFTYSIVGTFALIFGVVTSVAMTIATKSPKVKMASAAAIIVPAILGIVLVNAGMIGNIQSYRLYDGRILWWADSYYRISASGEPDTSIVDLDDSFGIYSTLNHKTMNIISQDPLTGTGPDQLVYPQLYTSASISGEEDADVNDIVAANKGTFDKVYNEFLYTAATRGVLSAVVLGIIFVAVIALAISGMKRRVSNKAIGLGFMVICGILVLMIGVSNITFSPIFWSIAGASCKLSQLDRTHIDAR